MMLPASFPLFTVPKVSRSCSSLVNSSDMTVSAADASSMAAIRSRNLPMKWNFRCSDDKAGYCSNFNGMKISFLKSLMVARTPHQRESRISTNYPTSVAAASASPLFSGQVTRDSCGLNFYKDVLKDAREKFNGEISFQSKDKDISLAKAKYKEKLADYNDKGVTKPPDDVFLEVVGGRKKGKVYGLGSASSMVLTNS